MVATWAPALPLPSSSSSSSSQRLFFSGRGPSPLAAASRCCCSSQSLEHTLSSIHNTFSLIQDSAIIACLRANSAELALEAARAALNGGISVLEIVATTPGVFEVLQCLVQEYPTKAFGVGTVLSTGDAKKATSCGAKFLMSPATVKDIIKDVQGSDVLYIPGVMSPTEIWSAYNAGAKIVKIYPVSALGGIGYISTLKKPFPFIPMVASQGVRIDSIRDYIDEGAVSVVLSDAIFDKEAMNRKNFNSIYQLALSAASEGRKAVELKKKYRPKDLLHI